MNRKEVLYITIALFMTVVAWVFMEVIYTQNRNQTDEVVPVEQPIESINIKFDALDKLKAKE